MWFPVGIPMFSLLHPIYNICYIMSTSTVLALSSMNMISNNIRSSLYFLFWFFLLVVSFVTASVVIRASCMDTTVMVFASSALSVAVFLCLFLMFSHFMFMCFGMRIGQESLLFRRTVQTKQYSKNAVLSQKYNITCRKKTKNISLRQISRQEIKIWKTEPTKKWKYKGKQSVNKLQVELTWKNNSSLIYVKLIGNRKGLLLDRLTCKRITSFWYIANTFWMFWKLNRIKTYHERLSKA